jgi:hypothetical protein
MSGATRKVEEPSMDFSSVYAQGACGDLVRFAEYCEALAGRDAMPRWSKFRPRDVAFLLGRIYLVDVIDGGRDFSIRLSGLVMKEIYGLDLEGHRLSELPQTSLIKTLHQNYAAVITARAPLFLHGVLRWPHYRIHVERLLVPFADEGGNLSTIVGAIWADVPLESLMLYRGDGPALYEPAEPPVGVA